MRVVSMEKKKGVVTLPAPSSLFSYPWSQDWTLLWSDPLGLDETNDVSTIPPRP